MFSFFSTTIDEHKLIIGLSVGIVIPVVIAAVGITIYIYRRQKKRKLIRSIYELLEGFQFNYGI